jgi:hypothetical protein
MGMPDDLRFMAIYGKKLLQPPGWGSMGLSVMDIRK